VRRPAERGPVSCTALRALAAIRLIAEGRSVGTAVKIASAPSVTVGKGAHGSARVATASSRWLASGISGRPVGLAFTMTHGSTRSAEP
jgi:hypothetical protein